MTGPGTYVADRRDEERRGIVTATLTPTAFTVAWQDGTVQQDVTRQDVIVLIDRRQENA